MYFLKGENRETFWIYNFFPISSWKTHSESCWIFVGFVSESWWILEVWKIWGCHVYLLNLFRGSFAHERILDLEILGIFYCFSTRIKYFNVMAAWSFKRWSQANSLLASRGFQSGDQSLKGGWWPRFIVTSRCFPLCGHGLITHPGMTSEVTILNSTWSFHGRLRSRPLKLGIWLDGRVVSSLHIYRRISCSKRL